MKSAFQNRLAGSIGAALVALMALSAARADITVAIEGPAGSRTQRLPDAGGSFAVDLPLAANAVNTITVTATDALSNRVEKTINLTQLSLNEIVVTEITTEPLPPERIQELVNEGTIDLEDPENFNVSQFNIVLTIDNQPTPVSVPIVTPRTEPGGYETYRIPQGRGSSGGSTPRVQDTEIIVFEYTPPAPVPNPPRITGVMVIEGRIKSLKEFFSVRFLIMNTSGIFTLKDVVAMLSFPDGGLSHTLPADGMITLGDVLPGDGGVPGQKEREFIIRGDEIGERRVVVDFGGTVAGPGLPEEDPIAFSGSAQSTVQVEGPPEFLVQVFHPPTVQTGEVYNLVVEIQNVGNRPALYASLELEVGADTQVEVCEPEASLTNIVCAFTNGPEIRSFGHIFPGEKVRETFRMNPLVSGDITSCLGISDQNVQLQVTVGNRGCLVGQFPSTAGLPEGVPNVAVVPVPNQLGVNPVTAVSAFFSELMDESSITTGPDGSFNVIGPGDSVVTGELRFIEINARSIAIWQVAQSAGGQLEDNTEYTVVLSQDIVDLDGEPLFNPWSSAFKTTSFFNDLDAPELSLTILPPVDPNQVLPGQPVVINAYAADQGSGVQRIELRIRDLDSTNTLYDLVDQKTLFNEDVTEPCIFTVDSGELIPGHSYELLGTAYDVVGNARDTTVAMILAASADPPVIVLPPDATNPVLQGVSVPLKPVAITGGVREVRYSLSEPATGTYATVFLAPWQATLNTLTRPLGIYTVRVDAVDALSQTGTDTYVFTLVQNINEPTVGFLGAVDGSVYLTGSVFSVNGFAEDEVGVRSVQYFLNGVGGTLLATGTAPFQVNTGPLATGTYSVVILASNQLGVANNPAAPEAVLDFTVVAALPGPPPPAPVVTSVGDPDDGTTLIAGTSVSNARVRIVNQTSGASIDVDANNLGAFSSTLPAEGGHILALTARQLAVSPTASATTSVVVPIPPLVTNLVLTPASPLLTAAGETRDFTVTAQLEGGGTSNVTARSAFSSSSPSVASVNQAGRLVAQGNGLATLTATFKTNTAQALVTVDIVTRTNVVVSPSSLVLVFTGQTATLSVTGQFSNGASAPVTSGVQFTVSDAAVISVNGSGVVTARRDGNAVVSVSVEGRAPVTVPVSVVSGLNPAPTVQITSPAHAAAYEPGDPVLVTVVAEDPIAGVTAIRLTATGAVSVAELRQISPPASNVTRSFSFAVPTNAAIGSSIHLRAVAEDIAGLTSTAASITLGVVDETLPAVSLLSPSNGASFNSGHTVTVLVAASDNVGLAEIGYVTEGALELSGSAALVPPATATNRTFSFIVPPGAPDPALFIYGVARDASGNARTSSPVQVELTSADITPPQTVVTAIAPPGTSAVTTVSYTVTDGFDDLDHVALYFRRNGVGTFNRYINPETTNVYGRFYPESGTNGTVTFDVTRLGGDGTYEVYSVGVDQLGNTETAPTNGFDRSQSFAAGFAVTVIHSNLFIGATNTLFADQNLLISNATVTIEGTHSFRNVELVGTSVLTHAQTTLTNEPTFNLTTWALTIHSNASINMDRRGYLGGDQLGNGNEGRTTNNAIGSTPRSGGSHGGLGGVWTGTPNPLYGNLTQPTELGSGGSSDSGTQTGGNGGGRIALNASHIAADGAMSANGGNGQSNLAGSGSGGSIYIVTLTLSGDGLIRANGGGFQVGGGGGRIGIFYVDLATKDTALIEAFGGVGGNASGGNGTVYLKGLNESDGTLVVDGQGLGGNFSGLPIPQGVTFDNLIIRNGARVIVDDPIEVNDSVQILTGSILTHSVGNTNGLQITARSVFVDATSAIDVDAKGYRGGARDGNASNRGETLHGQPGAAPRSGGSYGGLGSRYTAASNALVYGSVDDPIYLGSGGSSDGGTQRGGNGGGRIEIRATDAVTIQGALTADGGTGDSNLAGSGSGGSIKIITSLLSGSGSIQANGGGFQVGGGGGRIAIDYSFIGGGTNDFNDLLNIAAAGGKANNGNGSAGTVLLKGPGQLFGDLYVDETTTNATGSLWSPLTTIGYGEAVQVTSNTLTLDGGVAVLPGGLVGMTLQPDVTQPALFTVIANTATTITVDVSGGTNLTGVASVGSRYAALHRFDNVTLRRGAFAVIGDPLAVNGTLALEGNSVLTHPDATLNYQPDLEITAGTVSIASNSAINVNERGYLGGDRGGNGNDGRTLGNAPGSTPRSGGSYGGLGNAFSGTPNPIYGDLTSPVDLGSGGSSDSGTQQGGDGGGRVAISANNLIIDGAISANGGDNESNNSGSGSGGSIKLEAQTISGDGLVTANGGARQVGGGGGRVAVLYTTLSMDQASFRANGGQGSSGAGGNGTVYFKSTTQTFGDFIIDGNNLNNPVDSAVIPGGLTVDNLILRNGAQVVASNPIVVNGSVQILNNSVLRHPVGHEPGIVIQADSVLIDSNSAIDVTGRGYRGGDRDGNPLNFGETLGGQPGAAPRAGGSYGGYGFRWDGSGQNLPFGIPADANHLGSGGSSDGGNQRGGNGGGRVTILAAGSVTVNGAIVADGQSGESNLAGSGSGGSIRIETGLFQGNGVVRAHGGGFQVGGGGGRIAVTYNLLGTGDMDFSDLRAITAHGGQASAGDGSAGTVLLKGPGQAYGDLYIDEGLTNATTSATWSPLTPLGYGIVSTITSNELVLDGGIPVLSNGLIGVTLQPDLDQTNLFTVIANTETSVTVSIEGGVLLTDVADPGDRYAAAYRFDNVYLRRGAWLVLGDRLSIHGDLRVEEASKITHYDATLIFEPELTITAESILVDSNSAMDVDGRGYLGGDRQGNGNNGKTAGNIDGSTPRSGGSHGGRGAIWTGVPNPVHGDVTRPVDLGSGGSSDGGSQMGGDGGGRIRLTADAMTLDGLLSANGERGESNLAGSGAGGSILLEVGSLGGIGAVRANGAGFQVGGGGGRIAVWFDALAMTQGQFEALGGDGANVDGGHGTVYFRDNAATNGDLVIDGRGHDAPPDSTPLPPDRTYRGIQLLDGADVVVTSQVSATGTLLLRGTTSLRHPLSLETGVTIRAASLWIGTNAEINVTARGYRGGDHDGNPNNFGYTTNEAAGSTARSAGSYGGLGGIWSGVPNPIYGSATNPVHLGSGGSSDGGVSEGGHGGGRVDILVTSTARVDGVIRANGGNGEGNLAGSGSGGSILLRAGTLDGIGALSADGGALQVGGGGGRVAILVGTLTFDTNAVTAAGGLGANVVGQPGTVFILEGVTGFGLPSEEKPGGPRIRTVDVSGDVFLLVWEPDETARAPRTLSGPTRWIEFSPTLLPPAWTVLYEQAGSGILTGRPPAEAGQGFFRVRE